MDKLASLHAFVQVVEAGGFAAAARKMNLGRSAVNKMVVALENQLQVQLFHRSTRKVTPTPTGQAFYEKSVRILADLEEAELSVTRLHGEPRGILRVNAPMTFGTLHAAPAIARFMARYPQVQIELTLEDRFVDAIAEGYDAVIRVALPQASASLIAHELCKTNLVLCAAPGYLDRWGRPKTPKELNQHNCLGYGTQQSQWQLLGPEGECHISVSGAFWSNNGEALAIAAQAGLGIALLPDFIVQSSLGEQRLEIVLPDYCKKALTVSLLYPVNRHLSMKIKLLTEFLQSELAQL